MWSQNYTPVNGSLGLSALVAAIPVEIVKGGIRQVIEPALSRHERTAFENGLR